MRPHRRALRIALPTALAVGLVAVLVGPAVAAADDHDGSPGAPAGHGPAAPRATATVEVPAVALTEHVVASAGRIRTPLLLTEPGARAVARVEPGGRCAVRLEPGEVAWLSCAASPGDRVVVRLSDGRRAAQRVE
ncbi:MAG: hypothetical protein GC157_14540 [Frankiales bacterium]|nr:hypothetical protein [Frankiales bacterium]